jgi:hypothetical protein
MRSAASLHRRSLPVLAVSFLFLAAASIASAVEIRIPAETAGPGEAVAIPVLVDRVDNLAGLKLVIQYDKGVLVFDKLVKTEHTASLMHVVNDRNPGRLIVVMAGARGIQGENIPLFVLHFSVDPKAKAPSTTSLSVTEVQLMSDQLKELDASISARELSISGVTGPPPDENTSKGSTQGKP